MHDLFYPFQQFPFSQSEVFFKGQELLRESMSAFLQQDLAYRLQYAQKNFEVGFEGYSYPGQIDSINQAYDDHLHSMVLSEFYNVCRFPKEFESYLSTLFPKLKETAREVLRLNEWEKLFRLEGKIGFSLSVNYYPSFIESGRPTGPRLTEHIDGSFFTLFPYGFDNGLEYFWEKQWRKWPPSNKAVFFPGYLFQLLCKNKVNGLNHRLQWDGPKEKGRFAYALFVVPKPNATISLPVGKAVTAKDYYNKYLALFD